MTSIIQNKRQKKGAYLRSSRDEVAKVEHFTYSTAKKKIDNLLPENKARVERKQLVD